MELITTFSPYWFIPVGLFFSLFAVIFIVRKTYERKDEIKRNLVCACVTLALTLAGEFIAVSLNLWNYTGGNWPVILWVAYFVSGLLAFQLVMMINERVN